eukprot:GHVT01072526.1.p1 GENE.GHVT01072526.1~~GHVT01072526.1.p1  ORF type:complete len:735 (-),score=166.07 GHVT01072526.1:1234-3339(-)
MNGPESAGENLACPSSCLSSGPCRAISQFFLLGQRAASFVLCCAFSSSRSSSPLAAPCLSRSFSSPSSLACCGWASPASCCALNAPPPGDGAPPSRLLFSPLTKLSLLGSGAKQRLIGGPEAIELCGPSPLLQARKDTTVEKYFARPPAANNEAAFLRAGRPWCTYTTRTAADRNGSRSFACYAKLVEQWTAASFFKLDQFVSGEAFILADYSAFRRMSKACSFPLISLSFPSYSPPSVLSSKSNSCCSSYSALCPWTALAAVCPRAGPNQGQAVSAPPSCSLPQLAESAPSTPSPCVRLSLPRLPLAAAPTLVPVDRAGAVPLAAVQEQSTEPLGQARPSGKLEPPLPPPRRLGGWSVAIHKPKSRGLAAAPTGGQQQRAEPPQSSCSYSEPNQLLNATPLSQTDPEFLVCSRGARLEKVNPRVLDGKYVGLLFASGSCPACNSLLPQLKKFYEGAPSQDGQEAQQEPPPAPRPPGCPAEQTAAPCRPANFSKLEAQLRDNSEQVEERADTSKDIKRPGGNHCHNKPNVHSSNCHGNDSQTSNAWDSGSCNIGRSRSSQSSDGNAQQNFSAACITGSDNLFRGECMDMKAAKAADPENNSADAGSQSQSTLEPAPSSKIEIIYVPSDGGFKDFKKEVMDMPWLSLPFRCYGGVAKSYQVASIPSLVILAPDNSILHRHGESLLRRPGGREALVGLVAADM